MIDFNKKGREIRVGIVGLGGRGRDHLRRLSAMPDVAITAVCDNWQRLKKRWALKLMKDNTRRMRRNAKEKTNPDALPKIGKGKRSPPPRSRKGRGMVHVQPTAA